MQYREAKFKLDSTTRHVDANGAVHAKALIARVGIQKYYIDGKLIRELRPPEEVAASASEFENKPLTLDHPSVSVNSGNVKNLMKGFVNGVKFDTASGWLSADIHITHQDAFDASPTSHKEFSNGYFADIEEV